MSMSLIIPEHRRYALAQTFAD